MNARYGCPAAQRVCDNALRATSEPNADQQFSSRDQELRIRPNIISFLPKTSTGSKPDVLTLHASVPICRINSYSPAFSYDPRLYWTVLVNVQPRRHAQLLVPVKQPNIRQNMAIRQRYC